MTLQRTGRIWRLWGVGSSVAGVLKFPFSFFQPLDGGQKKNHVLETFLGARVSEISVCYRLAGCLGGIEYRWDAVIG